MTDSLREFYECLNQEERALAAEIATDQLGLLMRIAVNELDLDFEGVDVGTEPTGADDERSYLMRIGVVRIVKLAMQAHARFDAPTVTIRRNLTYSGAVLSLIGVAGAIEHGRRIAQSLTAKGGWIERLSDRFRIVLPAKLADLELHERELERVQKRHYRRTFAEEYEATIGAKIGDEVRSLLTDLVYVPSILVVVDAGLLRRSGARLHWAGLVDDLDRRDQAETNPHRRHRPRG